MRMDKVNKRMDLFILWSFVRRSRFDSFELESLIELYMPRSHTCPGVRCQGIVPFYSVEAQFVTVKSIAKSSSYQRAATFLTLLLCPRIIPVIQE